MTNPLDNFFLLTVNAENNERPLSRDVQNLDLHYHWCSIYTLGLSAVS